METALCPAGSAITVDVARNRKSPVAFRLQAKQDNKLYSAYQYAALSANPEDTPTRTNTETLEEIKSQK